MQRYFFILLLSFLLLAGGRVVYAQNNPDALKQEALGEIQQAQSDMERAKWLLLRDAGENNLKQAVELYVNAGKKLERAAQIFNALGAEYIAQQDIDGVNQALQVCLDAIENCKQRLQELKQSQ